MAIGGVIGAVLTDALGYVWAIYKDNYNPVAGLAAIGICKKRKLKNNQ